MSPDIVGITLPGVLKQLEQTPEIYMFTDSNGQWSIKNIQLNLIDDELGFMAWYTFDISQRQPSLIEDYTDYGETLQLCLGIGETTRLTITIQNPAIEEPVSKGLFRPESQPDYYHTLDATFGVNTETFIEFFTENPDGCLEVQYLKAE